MLICTKWTGCCLRQTYLFFPRSIIHVKLFKLICEMGHETHDEDIAQYLSKWSSNCFNVSTFYRHALPRSDSSMKKQERMSTIKPVDKNANNWPCSLPKGLDIYCCEKCLAHIIYNKQQTYSILKLIFCNGTTKKSWLLLSKTAKHKRSFLASKEITCPVKYWIKLLIPKLQRLHCWTLAID